MNFPKCFESQEQYDLWCEAAKAGCLDVKADSHCLDCELWFQQKMIKERRCEHPTYKIVEIK